MSEQKKGGEEKESKRKDNHFPSIKILTRINFGITGIKLHLAAQLKRSPIKDGKSWGKKLSLCVCVCVIERPKDSLCVFTYLMPSSPKEIG